MSGSHLDAVSRVIMKLPVNGKHFGPRDGLAGRGAEWITVDDDLHLGCAFGMG